MGTVFGDSLVLVGVEFVILSDMHNTHGRPDSPQVLRFQTFSTLGL